MNIELKLVEAFASIVRAGSLTKAEAQTGVAKATLSRSLQRLEDELGVQLLIRSARKIVPTEAGLALYSHCEALLADLSGRWAAARHEVQELVQGGQGRLKVLSDNQFTTTFVCHVVKLFLEGHPTILCELDVAERADSPKLDEVDCYVCGAAPNVPDVIAKPVGQLSFGLYASPQYVASHGLPVTPKELTAHDSIVLRQSEFSERVMLHSRETSQKYISRIAVRTNDYWLMKTFCLNGLGIALLPDFFVQPEVKSGGLVAILPDWQSEKKKIYCVYQRNRYGSKKLRAFLNLLTESMSDINRLNNYTASILPRTRKS